MLMLDCLAVANNYCKVGAKIPDWDWFSSTTNLLEPRKVKTTAALKMQAYQATKLEQLLFGMAPAQILPMERSPSLD